MSSNINYKTIVIAVFFSIILSTGARVSASAISEKTNISVTDSQPWFDYGCLSGNDYWWLREYLDNNYMFTYIGGPDSWAKFSPYLIQSGSYDVYVNFVASVDRSDDVWFHVYFDGGDEIVNVNQYSSYRTWKRVNLGTWTFGAGSQSYVKVWDYNGQVYDGSTVLCIGSLEFVKVNQPPSSPTLISPGLNSEPGPDITTLTPTFQWNSVPNADYYGLYISKYPYGSGNIVFDSEVHYGPIYGTSFTLFSGYLQDGVKYRWNMRAYNSAVWSDFSDRLYYTVNITPAITDQQKQQEILNMVNNQRGSILPELVLAIIRQEGGEGAFHVDGWNYNSFYRESDGIWAQPTNGDGIMQVTAASGYHERSGPYTHDQDGYDHTINDGCDYLLEHYNIYVTYVQITLHYNTGPNSLYIYLGQDWGDRNYLSYVAGHLSNFVPNTYGLENPDLVDALNQGQNILNDYLYNKGIATGQSVDYYKPYQTLLDNDLRARDAPVNLLPVADAGGPYSGAVGTFISFDGTRSWDPDGEIVSYAWDFGDGETATVESPSHKYTAADTYTVTLTVTDDEGATHIDTTTARVCALVTLEILNPLNGSTIEGAFYVTFKITNTGDDQIVFMAEDDCDRIILMIHYSSVDVTFGWCRIPWTTKPQGLTLNPGEDFTKTIFYDPSEASPPEDFVGDAPYGDAIISLEHLVYLGDSSYDVPGFDEVAVHLLAVVPARASHQFYGYVTIDGDLASDGISVAAVIDGIVYEEITTVGGWYGWDGLFEVPADDPDTPEKDGGVPGDLVELYLDGTYAGRSAIFENGGETWLDIDVNTGTLAPHTFFGYVTIDGVPAPDGVWVDIVIVTADGGEFYYSSETSVGSYGYDPLFQVPADDPDTPEIEGGVNGDTVYFYVDLIYATSYVFENGGSDELDLDITTSVYELQLYEGWNLIGIPCIPEVPYIELMLYDIIDYVESVWTYDGETGYWSSYSPGAPSDLYEMVDGKGYWIKVWTDVLWEIDTG